MEEVRGSRGEARRREIRRGNEGNRKIKRKRDKRRMSQNSEE